MEERVRRPRGTSVPSFFKDGKEVDLAGAECAMCEQKELRLGVDHVELLALLKCGIMGKC